MRRDIILLVCFLVVVILGVYYLVTSASKVLVSQVNNTEAAYFQE